jgi:hypothetical protein
MNGVIVFRIKMGVLQIKKKMLAYLMVGFLVATALGSMTVSATTIDNHVFSQTSPLGFDDNGDIAVFVFYEQYGKTDKEPRIVVIEDAIVTCEDINGMVHEMTYQELEQGVFGYFVADIPAGDCELSATKDGYSTETIDAIVFSDSFDIYRIELDETPDPRFSNLVNFGPFLRIIQIFNLLFSF